MQILLKNSNKKGRKHKHPRCSVLRPFVFLKLLTEAKKAYRFKRFELTIVTLHNKRRISTAKAKTV